MDGDSGQGGGAPSQAGLKVAGKTVEWPGVFPVQPGGRYRLRACSETTVDCPRPFALLLSFSATDGRVIPDAVRGLRNLKDGTGIYLVPGETQVEFVAPAEAAEARARIKPHLARHGAVTLESGLELLAAPPAPVRPAPHHLMIAPGTQPQPASYDVGGGVPYVLEVIAEYPGESPRGFALLFEFLRRDGTAIAGPFEGLRPFNRGPGVYLDAGPTRVEFVTPSDARTMRVGAYAHLARTGQIQLNAELRRGVTPSELEQQASEQLEALFSKADPDGILLCIYTGTRQIGEGHRANRSMMFAREAERLGITTIYTYAAKEAVTRVARDSDRLLQLPLPLFASLAPMIARNAPGRSRLLIGSMPDAVLCRNIGLFRYSGWQYVYECRDDWEEFQAVGMANWFAMPFERFAVQQASRVFCVSPALQGKMRRYAEDPAKVLLSPNATTDVFLARGREVRRRRREGALQGHPRIGYFGHLTPKWLDWGALIHAAKVFPHLQFDIIGNEMPALTLPANMNYLGERSHDELIDICAGWSIGLIPFKTGPLSRAVDPIKVYEYLSLGLKTVAAPMGSLEDFPLTFLYEEFGLVDCLARALGHTPTAEDWSRLDAVLENASWRLRLLDLLAKSDVSAAVR